MGKSGSCFKIITCSTDEVDRDDLEAPENKGSSDRRGWSFRKRSSRHQVLNSVVALETHSHANKEISEPAISNLQTPVKSTVPEKESVLQWPDEKPQLLTSADMKVSGAAITSESVHDVAAENNKVENLNEYLVIAIQTAIRVILAQAELLKLKSLVKLQAAVRGHLVRRHAVGTLRCVQALVKMQALVRARRARVPLAGAYTEENLVGDHGKDPRPSGKNHSISELSARPASIEKLFSNGFARRLLESTPKTKSIHIKCDPSRPNSAWKWLERWMFNSSSKVVEPEKSRMSLQQEEKLEPPHRTISEPAEEKVGIKPCSDDPSALIKSEDNLIIHDAEKIEFQESHSTSASIGSTVRETSVERDLLLDGFTQSIESSQTELKPLSAQPAVEAEHSKRFASEQLEGEGKNFVSGSRMESTSTFIATQSKIEDLSSTVKSGRSTSLSYQDAAVETNSELVSTAADAVSSIREIGLVKNSTLKNSRAQTGGSECDTELSVTSTLDSLEISESGALEYVREAKVPDKSVRDDYAADNVGSQDVTTNPVSYSSNSLDAQPGKSDDVNGKVGQMPERSRPDLQVELRSKTSCQVHGLSPEASPKSHTTVPESHGSPSGQLSVNAKRKKSEKTGSNNRTRSLTLGKRSPSNPTHLSGASVSAEQAPRDPKSGKSPISCGSAKGYHVDQEPGDVSSSNSLPSYMQPTKSARAKAHTSSPRSSPDLQDKDIYTKKRHSLPGVSGKEGSPRIQRSMSQAQQNAKGNGSHSPRVSERKWQR